jgi:hypothetical protein
MSRIVVRNLFSQARALRNRNQRLDLRWVRIHSACLNELTKIEKESLKIGQQLNNVVTKLERTGFGMPEIYMRMRRRSR